MLVVRPFLKAANGSPAGRRGHAAAADVPLDIGDYLGLTLGTISRPLPLLHSQGVLDFFGARQIVLRDHQRLQKMDV